MKTSLLAAAIFLMAISTATAGTGKQAFNTPSSLPPGGAVLNGFVEAVGEGASIAANLTVPSPFRRYAGIWHVLSDGTLDESMAPGGVTIHPDQTYLYGFDAAFDKLALAGVWGALAGSSSHSWFQTFSVDTPDEDPPAVDLAGLGTILSVDHDPVNSRFILAESISNPVTLIATDPSGALDVGFNGTGVLNTGISSNVTQVRAAPDGSVIVAASQSNYFTGATLQLRRYSSTGSLLNSFTGNIGFASLIDLAIDASGRPILLSLLSSSAGRQAMLLRYTSSLQPDASFGTAGKATFAFLASSGTYCNACDVGGIEVQADQKVIVGGYRNNNASLVVARVNTNGTLDSTFGSSGAQYLTINGANVYDGGSVALNEYDEIWITGGSYQSGFTNKKTVLMKLTADGALDTSFGSTP